MELISWFIIAAALYNTPANITSSKLKNYTIIILSRQCRGSMTFWCGSGSGSTDPCLWLMDPDPAIFVIDLQDACKKLIFNTIFSAYYLLKVHLHHFSKIKSQKESQNSTSRGFSYYFCIMMEGSGFRAGSGSIPLTNGSGWPKNMWIRRIRIQIRIRNGSRTQARFVPP